MLTPAQLLEQQKKANATMIELEERRIEKMQRRQVNRSSCSREGRRVNHILATFFKVNTSVGPHRHLLFPSESVTCTVHAENPRTWTNWVDNTTASIRALMRPQARSCSRRYPPWKLRNVVDWQPCDFRGTGMSSFPAVRDMIFSCRESNQLSCHARAQAPRYSVISNRAIQTPLPATRATGKGAGAASAVGVQAEEGSGT